MANNLSYSIIHVWQGYIGGINMLIYSFTFCMKYSKVEWDIIFSRHKIQNLTQRTLRKEYLKTAWECEEIIGWMQYYPLYMHLW